MDECPNWQTTRAHPRSRGENWIYASEKSAGAGSSPLTRGKRAQAVREILACGLIPAHAGKTLSSAILRCPPRAHPRSRGENTVYAWYVFTDRGSSPLTRGKQPTHCQAYRGHGLIPAHAGKTLLLNTYT